MIKFNFRYFREKTNTFPVKMNYELIEKERTLETNIPIYLDGDLDKVKSVPFGISIKKEMIEFNSKKYISGPFYNYQIENFFLLKNRIYFDNYEYQLNPLEKKIKLYDSRDVVEYDNAAFSSMRISTVFFGHWLREEMVLIDYLQGQKNILSSSILTKQKKEIIDLFGLNYNVVNYAKIKTANLYEGWQHSAIYKNILLKYKEKISLLPGFKDKKLQRIVYLKRGHSASKRYLENEDTMLEALSRDFDVLSFIAETTPVNELYAAIYSADIILSIEGSQMAHSIIAGKHGSTLVCIQPPYRFYNPFKNYCADVDIRYSVFIADQGREKESFYVDIDRLKQLFEKIYSDS